MSASAADRAGRSSHRGRARPRLPKPGRAPGRDRIASHSPSLHDVVPKAVQGSGVCPMSVATQVDWICRQGGITRSNLPRMAYRGSFPALAAEGDPLPRYAGRLPWRYDSLIEYTPRTHVKARPRRTTGWPAQRDGLVSKRSIVFPWIGGSAITYINLKICK